MSQKQIKITDTEGKEYLSNVFDVGGGGAALSDNSPLMNGVASAGTATEASRADHVHPSDSTKLDTSGGTITGTLTVNGTLSGDGVYDNGVRVYSSNNPPPASSNDSPSFPTDEQAEILWLKAKSGETLSSSEMASLTQYLLYKIAQKLELRAWTLELHLSEDLNVNSQKYDQLGPNTGFDSLGNTTSINKLNEFFDRLNSTNQLPLVLLCPSNPNDLAGLASLTGLWGSIGNYSPIPKIHVMTPQKFGFNPKELRKNLETVFNYSSAGAYFNISNKRINTLNFSHHDIVKRVLCDYFGQLINEGGIPSAQASVLPIIDKMRWNNLYYAMLYSDISPVGGNYTGGIETGALKTGVSSYLDNQMLLSTGTSEHLYNDFVMNMPVLTLDTLPYYLLQRIAENTSFANATQWYLGGNEEAWYMMRCHGVSENLITGDSSDSDKFQAFCNVFPQFAGTSLYYETILAFKQLFGYMDLINAENASQLYNLISQDLNEPLYAPMNLLKRTNIKSLYTELPINTSQLAEFSQYRELVQDENIEVQLKMIGDKLFDFNSGNYGSFINSLGNIMDLNDLLAIIDIKLDDFTNVHGNVFSVNLENF